MTIYNRQYQKLLSSELLRYLLIGNLPNLNEISSRLTKALGDKNNITYKYLPQEYKAVFNNKLYNKSLNKIKFDIDTFHEELIQMFADSSSRLNFADLYHKVNSYELNRLKAELELLLFTVADADFYFDGFSETFSDTVYCDLDQSTRDVVDLSEQCLSLPYGGANSRRINVGSLINANSVDISINRGSSSAQDVISSRTVPGTKFGNIFSDILGVWAFEVVTENNGPLSIKFRFPLNGEQNIEAEYFTTRFEVTPHSDSKQNILITTSNDDVNYLSLLGYEQGVMMSDQKLVYALDFETTLVQYIQISLSKTEADEEILEGQEKRYRYLFGLKRLAAYQTGRMQKATFISRPISFRSNETIGKLAINVDQQVPPGCSLNYYIAGVTNGVQSSFIPITPVGQDSSTGQNKVITFNSTLQKTSKFTVPSSGNDAPIVYGAPFQGKEFYRIGPVFTTKPIFGSSVLYRGYKSWTRDRTGAFEIINVTDNFVSFEQSDLESLYDLTTEAPQITSIPLDNDGVKRVRLQVAKTPYYDSSRGHALKPQPGVQNSLLDTRPNYAVYSVLHKADTSRRNTSFVLSSNRTQYLPISNFIIQSNDPTQLPAITLSGNQLYTEGVDYSFELIDIGGRNRPTGRITIPNGSAFLDPQGNVQPLLLEFSYVLDPDITHKVSRIEGNSIILEHASNTTYDAIEITYRFIPVAPSQIIKSSVRISDLPSTSSSRTYYVEGRDYVLDPSTGAIQRIPTGTIPTTGSAYAQFSYRGSSDNLQTFTTWAYISGQNGSQIKFDLDPSTKKNKLVIDGELGESFFVNSKEGLINLTKATSTPVLPFGWVQFIVRSKDPDTHSAFKTNLIDQVIQLKDVNKKKIFKQFNYYFNEITAFREPLSEKSLNHLKVNTLLSDHSSFAIDSITDPTSSYIVLNFKPNETLELYTKIPTEDSDETNPPASDSEDFVFVWNEKVDTTLAPSQVIVKVDLVRDQNTDGAMSPKVFSYQLRVGT